MTDRARLEGTRMPWVSLVLRLALAAVFLFAGVPKLTNFPASRRSVRAYKLFSYDVSNLIGTLLPMVEVALGVLLLVGLFTRFSALCAALLLVVFIAGIASAWARGLSIDCGCFSEGGAVSENATKYPLEIARDLVFLVMAGALSLRPRSRFSVDQALWG
ncbi:MauE/DoxX family redox-associated membrane protein [Dermacoccus abyssi]